MAAPYFEATRLVPSRLSCWGHHAKTWQSVSHRFLAKCKGVAPKQVHAPTICQETNHWARLEVSPSSG